MSSRVRRGGASGPAEWLLVFLQARDVPPRARAGRAIGPAEWLLVFLDAAGAEARARAAAASPPTAGPRPPAKEEAAAGLFGDRAVVGA